METFLGEKVRPNYRYCPAYKVEVSSVKPGIRTDGLVACVAIGVVFDDGNRTVLMSHFGVNSVQLHTQRIQEALMPLRLKRGGHKVFVFSADPEDMASQIYYDKHTRRQIKYPDLVERLKSSVAGIVSPASMQDVYYRCRYLEGVTGYAVIDTERMSVATNATELNFTM